MITLSPDDAAKILAGDPAARRRLKRSLKTWRRSQRNVDRLRHRLTESHPQWRFVAFGLLAHFRQRLASGERHLVAPMRAALRDLQAAKRVDVLP